MPPDQMATGAASATQIKDAFEFYRRGRVDEAERACRAILAREPDHFEARRLLGVVLYLEHRIRSGGARIAPCA